MKIVVDSENGQPDNEKSKEKLSDASGMNNNDMLLSDIDHSNFSRGKNRKKSYSSKYFKN